MDFQKRLKVAIARAGGQTALARLITKRFGVEVSPQRIQYLATPRRDPPATGSMLTPQIAAVTGLNPEWLATGKGECDAAPGPNADSSEGSELVQVRTTTDEVMEVVLSKAAYEVARAWMELSGRDRARFKREIELLALQHGAPAPDNNVRSALGAIPKKASSAR